MTAFRPRPVPVAALFAGLVLLANARWLEIACGLLLAVGGLAATLQSGAWSALCGPLERLAEAWEARNRRKGGA